MKFAKVMFSQGSVCPSVAGYLPHCMLGYTPLDQRQTHPRSRPPWEQTPQSRHSSRSRHLQELTPSQEQTPPQEQTPHRAVHAGRYEIWATSRQYASYWNAYYVLTKMYDKQKWTCIKNQDSKKLNWGRVSSFRRTKANLLLFEVLITKMAMLTLCVHCGPLNTK